MKRLRRKEPFGKAGLTVAICALVLAMVGGAYAAGGLTKSQEKQVTKIAKKYAGKPGAPGATGPAGTNGTNGKDGAAGAKGEQGIQGVQGNPGTNGNPGTPGTNGKSVTVTEIEPEEPECAGNGGAMVEEEDEPTSATEVCNGSPWTAGGTLPHGQTLRGEWGLKTHAAGIEPVGNSVSFSLPVESSAHNPPAVHILNENEKELVVNGSTVEEKTSTVCTGSTANPTAPAGTLCVYTAYEQGLFDPATLFLAAGTPNNVAICSWGDSAFCPPNTASRFGFGVQLFAGGEGAAAAKGTWAVTAF